MEGFRLLKVFKLGYVNLATQDLNSMLSYYEKVIGLSLVYRGENDSAYLSTSVDHHNIILTPSHITGIQSIGFQLRSDISLKEAAIELNQNGIKTELKSDAQPGVPELLEFKDEDDYIIQLYSSMEIAAPGFKQTGVVPNKLGHLSLLVKDAKRSVEFYKMLGFKSTDWIEDFFGFMTCNRDHHVLNFITSIKQGMHHMAFELRDYSHHIQSLDILGKNNIPILWGPSRHGAGHNIAAYHHDPEKNLVELFTDPDVYIEELDMFEPRPWHENFPQKPKVWSAEECMTRWGTHFATPLL
jgi:catechol-2,3-dioxygenase